MTEAKARCMILPHCLSTTCDCEEKRPFQGYVQILGPNFAIKCPKCGVSFMWSLYFLGAL